MGGGGRLLGGGGIMFNLFLVRKPGSSGGKWES